MDQNVQIDQTGKMDKKKMWESQVRDSGSGGDHGELRTSLLSKGPFWALPIYVNLSLSLSSPLKQLRDDEMDDVVIHRTGTDLQVTKENESSSSWWVPYSVIFLTVHESEVQW